MPGRRTPTLVGHRATNGARRGRYLARLLTIYQQNEERIQHETIALRQRMASLESAASAAGTVPARGK